MIKFILLVSLFVIINAKEPISPIPVEADYDLKKALLGKSLFFDTILSKDRSVSCFSCHNVYEDGGADSRDVSIGFDHRKGNIQSPTVLNARYNFVQFWNGRAKNLKEQASGPLNNPVEHNMNPQEIEKRLNKIPSYKEEFKSTYGVSYISYELVLDAIVEFEKGLTTPNSRFDKYLRGEINLTDEEVKGYKLFKHYGCITCHNGINVGSNSYQKIGTFIPYENKRKYPDRSEVTKNKIDENVFKVPTLRNISKTAPYFHDGSSKTLKEAITTMSEHNLGMAISDKDANYIISFLKTLDGETPKILNAE